jgi:hypothetical protein
MCDQAQQHLQHLWLYRHAHACAPQFEARPIKLEVSEGA